MKTVRFAKVVAKSGPPEPYTLWSAPEKDPHFQAALKAHRVMTVRQENVGSKKDFGEVGFTKGGKGALLLFPKSLKRFEGQRVVGVKYDLLKEARPAKTAPPAKAKKPSKPKTPPAPQQEIPPLRIFRPEEEEKPAAPKKPAKRTASKKPPDAEKQLQTLLREVAKAQKKLEQGNAVAAYRILEKAAKPA